MKKLFLLTAVIFGFVMANAQDQKPEAVVKVNTETYDFGKIKQNVPVTTFFELTNITENPIVIENAWASCGCTTPEYPKEPIAAGSTVKIKVGYNAAALNAFNKEVYIKVAGISQPKIVRIAGEVLDTAAYETFAKEKKGSELKAGDDKKQVKMETKTKTKTATQKTKTKTQKTM